MSIQDEFNQLPVGRREFLLTTLSAGFALAVQPISTATITTDSRGLTVGAVRIPVADGTIPAYRAMPATGGPFPIILVVHEIFGVHEHIQDVCRRLAKQGYLAIAPELFVRQGDVSRLQDIQAIRPVVAKVPDRQVFSDLDATVAWAAKSSKGNANKLGIIGFCWGGRIVWLYAAHSTQLKAGVAWYGRLLGQTNALQTQYPLAVSSQLKAPVLGLYGGKDEGIPNSTVQQMQDALKAANSRSKIIVYPDAPHGFYADYRPTYREKFAKDGWQRLLTWFQQAGVK